MSRAFTRAGRGLGALAVMAAFAAPGSAAAATPCANPDGTVMQGYAGDRYVLVQHAPGTGGGGTKVCFQSGGPEGGDVYRVLEVPASTGGPRVDNNADACRYYGGRTLLPDPAGVGSLVVSERATASEQWVCLEMAAARFNLRLRLPLASAAPPSFEEVAVAPARDTSMVDRSSPCDGAGTTKVLDLFVTQTVVELSHTAPDPTGRTTACVRAHDPATGAGFGGTFGADLDVLTRVQTSSDTSRCWFLVTSFEGVWVGARDSREGMNVCVSGGSAGGAHVLVPIPEPEEEEVVFKPHADTPLVRTSDDLSPCTQLVVWQGAPDYLFVDRSDPLGDGPASVCVSTAPGSGTRYEIQFPQDGPVQVSSDVSPCTHSLDHVGGVYPSVDSSVETGTISNEDLEADSYSVCVSVWGPGSGTRLQLSVPEPDPHAAMPDPVALPAVEAFSAGTSPDTTPCDQLVSYTSIYDDLVYANVDADADPSEAQVPGSVCVSTSQTEPVRVETRLPVP